jgi:ABC-type multidrug transport system fused ATPase/permease subunit
MQYVLDTALSGDIDAFLSALAICGVYFLVLFGAALLAALSLQKTRNKVVNSIRKRLMDGTLALSIETFQKTDSGAHISPFVNDAKILEENYIDPLFGMAQNMILFVGGITLMFIYSPIVAVFTIVSVLLMFILPSLIGTPLQKRQELYSKELGTFTSKLKDIFLGFEVIKSYKIEDLIKRKYEKYNNDLTGSKVNVDRLLSLNEALSVILGSLFQVGVICLSAYLVLVGDITAGVLLALLQLSSFVATPLASMFQSFPQMKSTEIVSKAIQERINQGTLKESKNLEFDKAITIQDLSFRYDDHYALKNINLCIEKGKKYAIVGKNGSGKSTLAKLIAGYYGNYEGELIFDGKCINGDLRDSILNLTAIIHQNVYLFNATIKENVCLYDDYPAEDIEKAVVESELGSVIEKDGLSYEYVVKENGQNLSGGQRQRIALARALICNKPLLILDEGTSALEQKTAIEIETNLLNSKYLTLITITHRLDAKNLSKYDSVIIMNDGEIVEQGSFAELNTKNGFFHSLLS